MTVEIGVTVTVETVETVETGETEVTLESKSRDWSDNGVSRDLE